MTFYVFWGCRYIENGWGIEEFETKEEALSWINLQPEELKAYLRVFEGKERTLKPVEIIKKFDLEE